MCMMEVIYTSYYINLPLSVYLCDRFSLPPPGGYVFGCICLFVCLCLLQIQKYLNVEWSVDLQA